jgi:hypothetical protein
VGHGATVEVDEAVGEEGARRLGCKPKIPAREKFRENISDAVRETRPR